MLQGLDMSIIKQLTLGSGYSDSRCQSLSNWGGGGGVEAISREGTGRRMRQNICPVNNTMCAAREGG